MQGVTRLGYIAGQEKNGIGGLAVTQLADMPLNVGDHVYIASPGKVTKDDDPLSYTTVALGIVVGGDRLDPVSADDIYSFGKLAVDEDGRVQVCYSGIAWALADGDITAGLPVSASDNVAGALMATDSTENLYYHGLALDTVGDGEYFRCLIRHGILNVEEES